MLEICILLQASIHVSVTSILLYSIKIRGSHQLTWFCYFYTTQKAAFQVFVLLPSQGWEIPENQQGCSSRGGSRITSIFLSIALAGGSISLSAATNYSKAPCLILSNPRFQHRKPPRGEAACAHTSERRDSNVPPGCVCVVFYTACEGSKPSCCASCKQRLVSNSASNTISADS